MTATATQLHTRATKAKGFKREDIGYGWGRTCVDCGGGINHLHAGDYCYQCDEQREREKRAAA